VGTGMGAAMIRHRRVSDVPAGAEPLASWIVAATSGAQHERWRAVNGPNQLSFCSPANDSSTASGNVNSTRRVSPHSSSRRSSLEEIHKT
jgi:hypothetical protein